MENKYPKNYLDNVIVRIDFASPLEDLRDNIPEELNQTILKSFPILEPKEIFEGGFEFKISKEQQSVDNIDKEKYQDWVYFGKNREKEVHISVKFFSVSYHNYQSFEELRTDFLNISKTLFTRSPSLGIKRLGLRYINKIFIKERNPTVWDKYIDKKLLCIFGIIENKNLISRAFQTLIFNEDDVRVTFQYGIFNSDFPAIIHKKEFILDFDAAHNELIENFSELEKKLERCRKPIVRMFENSITEALRRKMRE
ncbi:TIGR04255 family protein [Methanoregula sp.]|uniref:TIGR04255 family protein n=1 Tax=Methanoregula sp. TaxID=2052170 RepID=UPI003566D285